MPGRQKPLIALQGGVFLLALVGCLRWLGLGLDHSPLDQHPFRQAQTALTAYFMAQGGPLLAYETPVLGYPWAIPFELPLYQWMTVLLARSGLELVIAARLVSIAFFLAMLWPAALVLRHLGFGRSERLAILALVLASPLYIFWSRTVMIESTALFLAVAYLASVASWCARPRWSPLVSGALFGTLGAAVKVTTFAAFAVAASVWVAAALWRRRNQCTRRQLVLWSGVAIAAFALPQLVGTIGWVAFCDRLKELNPLADDFLTSRHLHDWNFGDLRQRLAPATWTALWNRLPSYVGHRGVLWIGLAALALGHRSWRLILCCLGLHFVAPLLFINLHFHHDYYQYANTIFGLTAFGVAAVAATRRGRAGAWLGSLALVAMVGLMLASYGKAYYGAHARDAVHFDRLGEQLRRVTNEHDVVAIWGADWNPSIPWAAKRRALMDVRSRAIDHPDLVAAFDNLVEHGFSVRALVFCGAARGNQPLIATRLAVFPGFERVASEPPCDLYAAPAGARGPTRP